MTVPKCDQFVAKFKQDIGDKPDENADQAEKIRYRL